MRVNFATYDINDGKRRFSARLFGGTKEPVELTEDEKEVERIILDSFIKPEYAGKVGNTIDPFKAAEKILAERYGHAKMVEAHYEWRPSIRY